jgi:hypothetical protein
MQPARTIFEHLSGITDKKTQWNKLTEADHKSFSPYIINRWLSMNYDLIELVDALQQYTIGNLDTKHVYELYYDLLPKQKYYSKYTKGSKTEKYNKDMIELIASHLSVSIAEATEYVDIWMNTNKLPLIEILKKYGKTEQEIKKCIPT